KGSSSSLSSSTTTVSDETETKAEPTTASAPISSGSDKNAFDDIADKPWAVEAINTLAELGIINGVGGGKFAPDFSCKRADFVIMLVNVLGIDGTASDNFDDVEAGKYYCNYVGLAKEAGIVNGYGNNIFKPENVCSREELMVMVANAIAATGIDYEADLTVLDKFSDTEDIADWAKPYISFLVANGVVNGANGKINPKNDITRAEVAVIMYNVMNAFGLGAVEEEPVETVEETEETEESEEAEETTEEAAETAEETVEEATEA
ncbi:MAG: S-layer homology domain-containing protein, partial [Firmicutes bacterium]|nr:S-layer homology domain-containing protein [Bacillota bacterium]